MDIKTKSPSPSPFPSVLRCFEMDFVNAAQGLLGIFVLPQSQERYKPAPYGIAPCHTTVHCTTPCCTPHYTRPHRPAPTAWHCTTPCHAKPYHTTAHCMTLYHATPEVPCNTTQAMLHYAMPHCSTPHSTVLCHTLMQHTTPHRTTPYCTSPRHWASPCHITQTFPHLLPGAYRRNMSF